MSKKILIGIVVLAALISSIVIGFNLVNTKDEDNVIITEKDENLNVTEQDNKDEEKNVEKEENTEVDENEENNTQQIAVDFKTNYVHDEYKVNNDRLNVSFVNTIEYPQVTSLLNTTAANKINNSIRTFVNEEWKYVNDSADIYVNKQGNQGMKLGLNISIKESMINDNVITFSGKMDGSVGGVGWTTRYELIYNAKTGEKITIKDIAKDTNKLKNYIYDYVSQELQNNTKITLFDDSVQNWRTDLNNYITNIDNNDNQLQWNLTTKGMLISLAKYSVAIGANGVIEITIPYSKINSYLKAEYQL